VPISKRPLFLKLIAFFCGMLLLAVIAGCGKPDRDEPPRAAGSFMTLKDDAGRTVSLAKKPERIVVLSTSFLELLYAVDGHAVGRPSSRTADIPEKAKPVPEIGFVYNVNIEKVLSLQPDLVIGFQGINDKLVPLLESSNIPVLLLKMKSFEEVTEKIKLFSELSGTQDKGSALVRSMNDKVAATVAKLPPTPKKIAILHATAKSVTLELETSIAGDIAKRLKLHNVAAGNKPLDSDMDSTPYSLEKLVEQDPELIFVVTMGQVSDIEKRMRADVETSPAWATLRAVKDGNIVFLPQELFQLQPGTRMPEAVEHMAKLAYPEVYK